MSPLSAMQAWTPPTDWLKITTIDSHTGGEPFRIITSGLPDLRGATILERRRDAQENLEHLRTALMWEPRGHADMYGCIITSPVTETANFGVLFMHNEGYSTMCGHGIIALATVVVETGFVPSSTPQTTLRIDTPAGLVTAQAHIENGRVTQVTFKNVPSFVVEMGATVEVAGLGEVRYDLAFGGAFYAYVQANEVGLTCQPDDFAALVRLGRLIKQTITDSRTITHPFEPDLGFLYGTVFVEAASTAGVHSRNVCIFGDGEVDRSPTGTGVSGRLAIHHARQEVGLAEPIVIESLIGSRFTGQVVETTRFGPYKAIVPEIAGRAHITGRHEFLLDPTDSLGTGFLLR